MNSLSLVPILPAALIAIGLCGCATLPQAKTELDPQADAILRAMSDKLAAATHLSFDSSRVIDASLVVGTEVQQRARGQVLVARPNQLRAESQGNLGERVLAYDGRKMLVWDKSAKVYAETHTGRNIDKMIDDLEGKWGVSPPLADLLVANPYKSLTGGGGTGKLSGTERVDGISCHRLSFNQPGAEWELWVAKSDSLPRKFVITFTGRPGNPKVVSLISNWNLSAPVPAGSFSPDTGSATKVEMIPLK